MSLFGDIERFVADLYPYRWPITIAALIALAAVIAFGYRRGWHTVIWRHKLASAIVAVAVLAVSIPAGDYFLSPLWERSFLEEAGPLAVAADMPADASSETASSGNGAEGPALSDTSTPEDASGQADADGATSEFTPRETARGEFEGADAFHFGRGQALLIETAPDAYTLRFENFSVRNGPDLFVYLSPSEDGFAEGAINLGALKATDGAFNYEVPAGTDVSQFKSAIVWCKQFSVLFAVASLTKE